MSKKIFISYAGRTVRTPFAGGSLKDLESSFTSKFPNSTAHFVFYTEDPVRTPYPPRGFPWDLSR